MLILSVLRARPRKLGNFSVIFWKQFWQRKVLKIFQLNRKTPYQATHSSGKTVPRALNKYKPTINPELAFPKRAHTSSSLSLKTHKHKHKFAITNNKQQKKNFILNYLWKMNFRASATKGSKMSALLRKNARSFSKKNPQYSSFILPVCLLMCSNNIVHRLHYHRVMSWQFIVWLKINVQWCCCFNYCWWRQSMFVRSNAKSLFFFVSAALWKKKHFCL